MDWEDGFVFVGSHFCDARIVKHGNINPATTKFQLSFILSSSLSIYLSLHCSNDTGWNRMKRSTSKASTLAKQPSLICLWYNTTIYLCDSKRAPLHISSHLSRDSHPCLLCPDTTQFQWIRLVQRLFFPATHYLHVNKLVLSIYLLWLNLGTFNGFDWNLPCGSFGWRWFVWRIYQLGCIRHIDRVNWKSKSIQLTDHNTMFCLLFGPRPSDALKYVHWKPKPQWHTDNPTINRRKMIGLKSVTWCQLKKSHQILDENKLLCCYIWQEYKYTFALHFGQCDGILHANWCEQIVQIKFQNVC